MRLVTLVALLLAVLATSSALAADPQPADPLVQPEPVWLQAGSSCEGEAGGAELFVSCPGQTAAQCCSTAQTTYPGFVGICQGDAEIQC